VLLAVSEARRFRPTKRESSVAGWGPMPTEGPVARRRALPPDDGAANVSAWLRPKGAVGTGREGRLPRIRRRGRTPPCAWRVGFAGSPVWCRRARGRQGEGTPVRRQQDRRRHKATLSRLSSSCQIRRRRGRPIQSFGVDLARPGVGDLHLVTTPPMPPETSAATLESTRGRTNPAGQTRYLGLHSGSNFSLYWRKPWKL
jgi:hypothetical protein